MYGLGHLKTCPRKDKHLQLLNSCMESRAKILKMKNKLWNTCCISQAKFSMTETFSCAVLARNIIVAAGIVAEIYSPYLTWDIELFENEERIN